MNDITTTTKVTKLTGAQAAALTRGVADNQLAAEVSKTTVTFLGTASEANTAVRNYQELLAAKSGRTGGDYQALHAVARKLETGKDTLTTTKSDETVIVEAEHHEAPAPKLTLVADSTDPESLVKIPGLGISVPANPTKAEDGSEPKWATAKGHGLKEGDLFLFYGTNDAAPKAEPTVRNFKPGSIGGVAKKFWAAKSEPKKAEKSAPAKKDAPAKKTAGARSIPQEATNSARQAWIAEHGLDAYKKAYNGGWDNATYGQGEKKAKSGEASPAWMDGYTDRKANPGREGIKAKWAALKSSKAPVAKIS